MHEKLKQSCLSLFLSSLFLLKIDNFPLFFSRMLFVEFSATVSVVLQPHPLQFHLLFVIYKIRGRCVPIDTMTSQNSCWPALAEWEWASVLLFSHVSAVTTVTKPTLNKTLKFCYLSVLFLDPDVLVGKCFDRCSSCAVALKCIWKLESHLMCECH